MFSYIQRMIAEQVSDIETVLGLAFAVCVLLLPILGVVSSLLKKLFPRSTQTAGTRLVSGDNDLSGPKTSARSPLNTSTERQPLIRPAPVQSQIEEQRRRDASALAANTDKKKLQPDYTPPGRCNICRGSWTRRENQLTGGRFWGCSNFPRCTNTFDAQARKPKRATTPKRPAPPEGQAPKAQVHSPKRSSASLTRATPHGSSATERTYKLFEGDGRNLSLHHSPEQRRRAERFWQQEHPMGLREECQYGHPFTEDNTFYRDRAEFGRIERECRTCRKTWR